MILQKVTVDRSMPMAPFNTLITDQERNMIGQWIQAGAVEGNNTPGTPNPNPTIAPSTPPTTGETPTTPPTSGGTTTTPPTTPPSTGGTPAPTPNSTPAACIDSLNSKLIASVTQGDDTGVANLLAQNACGNAKNNDGRTALLIAAMDLDATRPATSSIIQDLLNHGAAQVINETSDGANVLLWSIARGIPSAPSLFVNAGADLNQVIGFSTRNELRNVAGYSALMLAVNANDFDLTKLLLAGNASTSTIANYSNVLSPKGTTAYSLIKNNSQIQQSLAGYLQVSFTRDITPILNTRCIACHNAQAGFPIPDLTNYKKAAALKPKIFDWVVQSKVMPPNNNATKMTDAERQVFAAWVIENVPFGGLPAPTPVPTATPSSTPAPSPNPNPAPAGLTYTKDVSQIFQTRCFMCHNSSSPIPNWMDYSVAFSKKDTINKRVVQDQTMPPGNMTGMTPIERKMVGDWISEGAPQ